MLCTLMKAESSSSFDVEEISEEEETFLAMLLTDLTHDEVKWDFKPISERIVSGKFWTGLDLLLSIEPNLDLE